MEENTKKVLFRAGHSGHTNASTLFLIGDNYNGKEMVYG